MNFTPRAIQRTATDSAASGGNDSKNGAAIRDPGEGSNKDFILIRKYANRRLYSTNSSKYVTLDDLRQMVGHNTPFRVVDSRTNEDITRIVLTQIILESESTVNTPMSERFMRRMIEARNNAPYGQVLSQYLDIALSYFDQNQSAIDRYMKDSFGKLFPVNQFRQLLSETQSSFWSSIPAFQNMMISPTPSSEFPLLDSSPPHQDPSSKADLLSQESDSGDTQVHQLQHNIASLQKQINALAAQLSEQNSGAQDNPKQQTAEKKKSPSVRA